MRMGMGKNKINMGNARIKMRKKHMIGFVRHEIVYRRRLHSTSKQIMAWPVHTNPEATTSTTNWHQMSTEPTTWPHYHVKIQMEASNPPLIHHQSPRLPFQMI
jgi:hypothetical protein